MTDEIKALNPMQRLPILVLDDGTAISESVAICRYFEELHPEPPLMGTTPLEKATIEMWQRRAELDVLERLVDYFEAPLPEPFRLRRDAENSDYADRLVSGTVGFSLRVERYEAKDKMSQDKPPEVVERVIEALRQPGPHHNPPLAERMAAHQRLRPLSEDT
ncbi:MAG: glutathione S-transferase N-terminal domain-containing protein [Actinomycetota bacterium]